MKTEPLAWDEVAARLPRVLGEPVSGGQPLTPGWSSRMTWAARGERTGPLVVKVRHGDRAYEKTAWCAGPLPLLGARGYPVPAIIWHGMARGQWHVTVENRLPGYRLTMLDGRLLEEVLQLVEKRPAPRSRRTAATSPVSSPTCCSTTGTRCGPMPPGQAGLPPLCARIRRWLQPLWGLRLPPADYAHNDLNLSNILTDGEKITGVVDWDEFGLGSRALDLVALALDCQRCGAPATAGLLVRAASAAGLAGLCCLVSYRALAGLAEDTREGQPPQAEIQAISAILDGLQAPGN